MRLYTTTLVAVALLLAAATGCDPGAGADADVVLYTSIDEPVARQVIDAFEHQTGLRVRLVTDTEATKSVGLAERLRAEKDRPRADVWWGNEPFHTIALAEEGLLAPCDSPAAADVPAQFRDPQNRWVGNGLRARVIAAAPGIVGTSSDLLIIGGAAPPPKLPVGPRLQDLAHPAWKGKVAMARPTAGTTGSHVAALYVLWGQDEADAFFRALRQNGVALLAGNSQVAQQVGAGNYLLGLTDNDDVHNARNAGGAVEAVLPDQWLETSRVQAALRPETPRDGIGTLTIPTTVGLVAGRPDSDAALRLVDFLLSADVERRLMDANFCAYSVRAAEGERAVKSMQVDYAAVARRLPSAVTRATAILEGREP